LHIALPGTLPTNLSRDFYPSSTALHCRAYDWDFYKSEEEGNTGFYFVRSNSRTIKLWKDALATAPKYANEIAMILEDLFTYLIIHPVTQSPLHVIFLSSKT
jgi:hypothetical protein